MSQFGSSISIAASNPRPAKPAAQASDGLLIIGAGLGRTGTSSLQEALHILGYGPVYHMREVIKDPNGVSKWQKVAKRDEEKRHRESGSNSSNPQEDSSDSTSKQMWDDIFWGYSSTVDHPSCLYYKELMELYPNAKIILTVRDSETKWYRSVINTIAPPTKLWRFLYKITFLHNYQFNNIVNTIVWKPLIEKGREGGSASNSSSTRSVFNIDDTRNKEIMTNAYRKHNEEVQKIVPSNKLLIFNVKDGWEPLCKFLNCPIPTTTKTTLTAASSKEAEEEKKEEKSSSSSESQQPLDFPHVWHSKQVQRSMLRKRQKCIIRLGIMLGITTTALVTVAFASSGGNCSNRSSNGGTTRVAATSSK